MPLQTHIAQHVTSEHSPFHISNWEAHEVQHHPCSQCCHAPTSLCGLYTHPQQRAKLAAQCAEVSLAKVMLSKGQGLGTNKLDHSKNETLGWWLHPDPSFKTFCIVHAHSTPGHIFMLPLCCKARSCHPMLFQVGRKTQEPVMFLYHPLLPASSHPRNTSRHIAAAGRATFSTECVRTGSKVINSDAVASIFSLLRCFFTGVHSWPCVEVKTDLKVCSQTLAGSDADWKHLARIYI